ncbi:hypothetical protein ES703_88405 [subsurface metagenome]
MQNRPRGDYSSDEVAKGDSGVRIVECPHCKDNVPLSIYCLKCGYPMFELMKEHMRRTARTETRSATDTPLTRAKSSAWNRRT